MSLVLGSNTLTRNHAETWQLYTFNSNQNVSWILLHTIIFRLNTKLKSSYFKNLVKTFYHDIVFTIHKNSTVVLDGIFEWTMAFVVYSNKTTMFHDFPPQSCILKTFKVLCLNNFYPTRALNMKIKGKARSQLLKETHLCWRPTAPLTYSRLFYKHFWCKVLR